MSDLIVIGYPDEETAEKVWDELVKLQEDFLVDLEDAAIIRRDQKGRLHVTTPAHHAVIWGTLSGLFWGVLIGLIFLWPLAPVVGVAGGIMGAALGAAGNLGIKDEFRQRVQEMLQPGTSAIMVIVRKVTPDKFIEALKPYGGMVLKTSLPHDAEQQLMKALHGDDPSAPTWQQPASPGARGLRRRLAALDRAATLRVAGSNSWSAGTSCRACHVWPTTVCSGWCWPPRCGPRATGRPGGPPGAAWAAWRRPARQPTSSARA